MTLNDVNELNADDASSWFEQCCASKVWIYHMVNALPYQNIEALNEQAIKAWAKCSHDD